MKVLDSQPVFFRFWAWFYGDALNTIWQIILTFALKIFDTFSIGILFSTLFDPWKKDVVYAEKLPLNLRIQAFFWNIFSRIIGFFIRLVILLLGFITLFLVYLLGILFLLLWILFPFIIIYGVWYSFYLLI